MDKLDKAKFIVRIIFNLKKVTKKNIEEWDLVKSLSKRKDEDLEFYYETACMLEDKRKIDGI
jgi:hypothetical protein